ARAEAFSRRTSARPAALPPLKLEYDELALIDRLVRHDRTAVSSAPLVIAGVGSGAAMHRSVVASVRGATRWALADGTISSPRAAQIARHLDRALERTAVHSGV